MSPGFPKTYAVVIFICAAFCLDFICVSFDNAGVLEVKFKPISNWFEFQANSLPNKEGFLIKNTSVQYNWKLMNYDLFD